MAVDIDIIILSYAKNEQLKALTEQTLETLTNSENPQRINFNLLVIESNRNMRPFQYKNAETIYPEEEFGFNKYLNIGLRATSSRYVCLCNNDLIFRPNWATEILKVFEKLPQIMSANPFCERFHPSLKTNLNKEIIVGNKSNMFNGILTGWCIFIKRELLDITGYFDERFSFWYADRDYGKTLLLNGIKHALIVNSKVIHIGNMSHSSISEELLNHMTYGQKEIYEKKWGKDSSAVWQNFKKYLMKFK